MRSIDWVKKRAAIVGGLAISAMLMSAVVVAAPTTVDRAAKATTPAVRGVAFQVGDDPVEPPPPQPTTARYRVALNIVWDPTTHPTTIPAPARRPHVSPPVLATHAATNDMFARGAVASNGIEAMAETGATGSLVAEMGANSNVTSVATRSSIFGAGSTSFEVDLSQTANMVSLVTMLAPSPDWFVGVNSLPLFVDGAWVSSLDANLAAYDAGTDSAPGFVHSNTDTNPAQPISGPRDPAFVSADAEGRFGFVTITRLS